MGAGLPSSIASTMAAEKHWAAGQTRWIASAFMGGVEGPQASKHDPAPQRRSDVAVRLRQPTPRRAKCPRGAAAREEPFKSPLQSHDAGRVCRFGGCAPPPKSVLLRIRKTWCRRPTGLANRYPVAPSAGPKAGGWHGGAAWPSSVRGRIRADVIRSARRAWRWRCSGQSSSLGRRDAARTSPPAPSDHFGHQWRPSRWCNRVTAMRPDSSCGAA